MLCTCHNNISTTNNIFTTTTTTEGKAGSLVDSYGRFYKPLQVGPRGKRERAFYETLAACLRTESAAEQSSSSCSSAVGNEEDQPYSQDSSPLSPPCGTVRFAHRGGKGGVDAPRAWQNLFSVRNAALLNVVPRFCTWWLSMGCVGKGLSMLLIVVGWMVWLTGSDWLFHVALFPPQLVYVSLRIDHC